MRTTLGRYPAMAIDQARKQLGLMVTGIDPNKAKKAERIKDETILPFSITQQHIDVAEAVRKNFYAFLV